MKRIKLTALTLMLCAAMAASAQINIPGTNVSFTLPSGEWMYLKTVNVDKNTQLYLYSYAANPVIDSVGDTIIPYMSIYVRHNYTPSTFDFVFDRYMANPYQSLNEYSDGLPGEDAIGYLGAYKHDADGKNYKFRMIYFKDKKTIFEIRLETSMDNYDDFDEKFLSIINSVIINK